MSPLTLADATADASQLLHDAIANHGWVIAACAGLIILVPLVLKALGKNIPGVDLVLDVAVGLLKSFSKKPAPAPAPTEEQKAAEAGVTNVVDIKKLGDDK